MGNNTDALRFRVPANTRRVLCARLPFCSSTRGQVRKSLRMPSADTTFKTCFLLRLMEPEDVKPPTGISVCGETSSYRSGSCFEDKGCRGMAGCCAPGTTELRCLSHSMEICPCVALAESPLHQSRMTGNNGSDSRTNCMLEPF